MTFELIKRYQCHSIRVKKITIMFDGVSISGTDNWTLRIGDSGGMETSGYVAVCSNLANVIATASLTSHFFIVNTPASASRVLYGAITLYLEDSANNTWVLNGLLNADIGQQHTSSGRKALTGVLTQLEISTVNNSDTFDAGAFNIMWE